MVNYPGTQYLAAQHRDELLREAERERLAQAATEGPTSTGSLAHHMLHELGRQLLMRVRHATQDQAAASSSASPA